MAMPSMSGRRSGHDMDILKSILGCSSEHSSTDEKQSSKTHSRKDSSSSSSSLTSCNTESTSQRKTGHGIESSYSDSESKTESQRDHSSSLEEKSLSPPDIKQPKGNVNGIDSEKNETKAHTKQTSVESVSSSLTNLDLSSVSLNKDDVVKNKGIVKRRKKSAIKRKQMTEIKKMDTKCEKHVSDENKVDNVPRQRNNSLNESYCSSAEVCLKKPVTGKQVKKHQKNLTLSKRAQRTLNLYPQRYSDPDRLARNYQELQEILDSQFINGEHALNNELVKETKRILGTYQYRQAGYTGTLRPPPGIPPAGRRVRRIWSASQERSPGWTQTDLDEGNKKRPQSAKGYYFIDTTKPDQSKRVTFVQEGDEFEYENITHEVSGGLSTYTVSVQLNEGTRPLSSELDHGRISRKISRRPKSATQSRKTGSGSRSPSMNQSQTGSGHSTSESSTSRSRSSQSRSPSSDRRVTDNHLENTNNTQIKKWLKQKNKLLRRQKREEKRLQREKRKKEEEEARQRMAKQEQAEILFRKWVEKKQKEARLLKKRKQNHQHELNYSGTAISSETETVDLKSGENVITIREKNASKDKVSAMHIKNTNVKSKNTTSQVTTKLNVDMNTQDCFKCTCNLANSTKSTRTEVKVTQFHAKSKKSHQLKPQNSSSEPSSTKSGVLDEENSEEKKRLSYDEWLKQKRSEDMERKKLEKKQQEEQMTQSDPEMDSIISGMAKRRIKNILQGKKPIKTGNTEADDEANKTMDEKLRAKQQLNGRAEEVAPSSGSSARFYRWVPKDGDKTTASNTKRPMSAHVRSSRKRIQVKGERPASAKSSTASSNQANTSDTGSSACETANAVGCGAERQALRAVPPKPKTPQTKAYKEVKYQLQSWDQFSDYVWEKLNKEELAADNGTKSEHQELKEQVRNGVKGKPQKQSMFDITSNTVDNISQKDTDSTDTKTDSKQSDVLETEHGSQKQDDTKDKSKEEFQTEEHSVEQTSNEGESNEEPSKEDIREGNSKEEETKDENLKNRDVEEMLTEDSLNKDEPSDKQEAEENSTEDTSNKDEDSDEQQDEKNTEDDKAEVDVNTADKQADISLISNSNTTVNNNSKADGKDEISQMKQNLEEQCISEVISETIFSMTEMPTKLCDASPKNEFTASELRRQSVVLEKIPEEVEDSEQLKEDTPQSSTQKESMEQSDVTV